MKELTPQHMQIYCKTSVFFCELYFTLVSFFAVFYLFICFSIVLVTVTFYKNTQYLLVLLLNNKEEGNCIIYVIKNEELVMNHCRRFQNKVTKASQLDKSSYQNILKRHQLSVCFGGHTFIKNVFLGILPICLSYIY